MTSERTRQDATDIEDEKRYPLLTFEQIRDAAQASQSGNAIIQKYLQGLEKGIQHVLARTGHSPYYHWTISAMPSRGIRVDEGNQTVWVGVFYEHDGVAWFAANTDNFTGTKYPIAWVQTLDPEEVYESGNHDEDAIYEYCNVRMF